MKYPAGPELLEVQAQAEQAVIVSLKGNILIHHLFSNL